MIKETITCLGLILALWVQPLYAQDVHFSQVELSPLTLNPALAGSTSAFRGIAMYRSQYGSFATPFQTITASLDGKLTSSLKGANSSLGAGINFYNDRIVKMSETYHNFDKYSIPEKQREVYKTIGGAPHLDQNYTVFGEVVEGFDVIDSIASSKTDSLDRPIIDVRILSVRVLE